jgi:hypothetical protein
LLVVFGRRRVGKTRLLAHWLEPRSGFYSQAIEDAKEIQLDQVFQDAKAQLETNLVPMTWAKLLELVGSRKQPLILCVDEFPCLVASVASLPSIIQRWLDLGHPGEEQEIPGGAAESQSVTVVVDTNQSAELRAISSENQLRTAGLRSPSEGDTQGRLVELHALAHGVIKHVRDVTAAFRQRQ